MLIYLFKVGGLALRAEIAVLVVVERRLLDVCEVVDVAKVVELGLGPVGLPLLAGR